MEEKLVSIIIPTYNRPVFLERALKSALNQTYKNVEVIVVDDNNPDTEARFQTEELMEKYKAIHNLYYIKHFENKNGSAARNTGVKNSHGEYIAFLDDDDEFLPNKIEAQISTLSNKNADFQVCYSNYVRMQNNGKIVDKCGENREGNLYLEALKRNLYVQAGSNLLLTKKAYDSIGGFDESFKRNQDLEFISRLMKKYKIAYSSDLGLKIYLGDHSNNKVDYYDVTTRYIDRMKSLIDELDESDREEVYSFLFLQVYRYYFFKLKMKKARVVRKKYNLRFNTILKYFLYLIKRRINKKCYGFFID